VSKKQVHRLRYKLQRIVARRWEVIVWKERTKLGRRRVGGHGSIREAGIQGVHPVQDTLREPLKDFRLQIERIVVVLNAGSGCGSTGARTSDARTPGARTSGARTPGIVVLKMWLR
jgi:hypothetical protein